MKRRYLIPLAAVAGALTIPGHASAHTPNVSDSCTGLTVVLTNYETTPGPALNNRITITIDGASQSFDFDAGYSQTFGWSQTSAHTWTVVVDANRLNGHPTQWDRTFNGTEPPCQQPSTTTSTTAPTTTAPTATTTIPATTTTVSAPSSTTSTSVSPTTPTPPSSTPPTTVCTDPVECPTDTTSPETTLVSPDTTSTSLAAATTSTVEQAPAEPLDPARTALPATGSGWLLAGIFAGAGCVALGALTVRLARRP